MTTLARPAIKGFTLIEAIVYFALMSAIITGMLVSSYPLFTNTERSSAGVARDLESAFVFRKISYLVNRAVAVQAPGPGSSGNTLRILDRDSDVYELSLDGDSVVFSVNGGPELSLTAARVEISSFEVSRTGDVLSVTFNANGVPMGPYTRYVRF